MCRLANVNYTYDNSFIEYDSSNYILIKEVCSSYFYFQGMRLTVVSTCEEKVDNTLPLITIGDILNLILVPLENEMECFCRQAYDSWKGLYLHNKYLYLGNSVKKFCLVSTENIKELYYLPPE